MQDTYLPMHRNLRYVATCSTLCFGLPHARVRSFVFIVIGVPTIMYLFKNIWIYIRRNDLVFWSHISRYFIIRLMECFQPHCCFENKKDVLQYCLYDLCHFLDVYAPKYELHGLRNIWRRVSRVSSIVYFLICLVYAVFKK